MSAKISEIVDLDPNASNPVMLLNMYKYQWQLFAAKGFRARDHTYPVTDRDGSNMVFVAGEKQLYRGYIGGLDSGASTLRAPKRMPEEQLKTYVAKRNRVTGQMRLVEVKSCQLENVSHDQTGDRKSIADQMDERTLQRTREKFKSKTGVAAMRRMQNKTFDLSIIDQKLKQTLEEHVVQDNEVAETNDANPPAESDAVEFAKMEDEIRAKANPDASRLCDLYNAESLIGSNVFAQLKHAANELLQTDPEQLSMASDYLENKVKALMQSVDATSEANLKDARICLFMDVLLRLVRRDKMFMGESKNVSPFTPVLNEPIRKQFMQHCFHRTNDQTRVTKYTQHKALMYYLALAFVLEGREVVSVDVVHQSLKVSKQELIMFARIVGATYDVRTNKFAKGKGMKPRTDDMDIIIAAQKSNRKFNRR